VVKSDEARLIEAHRLLGVLIIPLSAVEAVSSELKRALQEAVEKFEATISEPSRDWHPGSNKKVLHPIHPSLYPLFYDHTRILSNGGTTTLEDCIERCGEGEIIKIFSKKETPFSANLLVKTFSGCHVEIESSKLTWRMGQSGFANICLSAGSQVILTTCIP
jgi:hypothetical protein